MFSRLRVWWASRGRELFCYYDGRRWRRGDPIAITAALEATCPKYVDLLSQVTTDVMAVPMGEMREQAEFARKQAVGVLAKTARTIFGLPALGDTSGLSDMECLGVLASFFRYMEGLAEQARVFGSGGSRSGPAAGTTPENPVGGLVAAKGDT